MPSLRICLLFLIFFNEQRLRAENQVCRLTDIQLTVFTGSDFEQSEKPGPLFKLNQLGIKAKKLNRRLTAALLAFPFPFGIVGLHRIYLGCAPYVPVVYIASLGGVFGILPLIDFIIILTEKDLDKFKNSGKVFMWVE